MPRGDATRGAGLSTYYEPRLLSSRFFFSPRVSPPDAARRCLSPFRPLCVPYLPFPSPPGSYHDPTESPFSPRYFTAPRTLLRVLYLLVFSGLVFIPNAASRMRTFVVYMYVYVNICMYIRSYTHAKGECVWPILALMRTPPRMRGPPSASFLLSLSLAASLFAFESPRLLDSRSRALKLRRQPNKLIRIVRARRTSRFCLPSLPPSLASE